MIATLAHHLTSYTLLMCRYYLHRIVLVQITFHVCCETALCTVVTKDPDLNREEASLVLAILLY